GKWNFRYGGKADANGVVRLVDGVDVFQDRPLIIARHATRGLAAVKRFGEKDRSGVVDITLQPECHVQWRFASSQVKSHGHELGKLSVTASFDDILCSFTSVENSAFHAFLPPGKFTLVCNGRDVNSVSKEIEIRRGQKSLDLGTSDLSAKQFVVLEG